VPWLPSKSGERYTLACIEVNSFALEEQTLRQRRTAVGSGAHHTARVDDTVPRNACATRERVKRVSDESRLAWKSGKDGNLPVGRDASSRYSSHDRVDAFVRGIVTSAGARPHLTAEAVKGT